jgi:hypothetical protein
VDEAPLKSIGKVGAVAVEIWTMSGGMVFDNFLITTDAEVRKLPAPAACPRCGERERDTARVSELSPQRVRHSGAESESPKATSRAFDACRLSGCAKQNTWAGYCRWRTTTRRRRGA